MGLALSFALGVLILQQSVSLPPEWLFPLLAPIMVAFWLFLPWPAAFVAGFLYAWGFAWLDEPPLPMEYETVDLVAVGTIASLPSVRGRAVRFDFVLESLKKDGRETGFSGRVRLSDYGYRRPEYISGDRWRFMVRLKRPRGQLNPGGFDYEAWLWRRNITATGYIKSWQGNEPIASDASWSLHRRRQLVRDAVNQTLPRETAALINALTIGDRSQMTPQQWKAFRATGSHHLVAISGLHVGMVTGLMLLAVQRLWRLSSRCCEWLPAPKAAAVGALTVAVLYAAIAGFTIPTQRALLMVAALLLPRVLSRQNKPLQGLAAALTIILIIDPRSIESPAFILSFAAVAAIVWALSGGRERNNYLHNLLRLQFAVLLLITPLSILLFNQVSLLAFPVNLLAIPWFTIVLVPAAFVAVLVFFFWPALGVELLGLIAPLYSMTLEVLTTLSLLPFGSLYVDERPVVVIFAAMVAGAWLMAPVRLPGRYLGVVLLLPMLLWQQRRPEHGAFEAVMLDVGQGLAVSIRTEKHLLLYDSGPSYGPGGSAGESIIHPYLRNRGESVINRIVISHNAADHAGGLVTLLDTFDVGDVLANHGLTRTDTAVKPCRAGKHWRWDGVSFRVLHPQSGDKPHANNASCVLLIENANSRLLLTGDLESSGEAAILPELASGSKQTFLQVGHHGSNTSSSQAFVQALAPRYALISSGYRNRYGFPAPEVVERWQKAGAMVLDTARSGAIQFYFESVHGTVGPRLEREVRSAYWRQ